MDTVKLVLLVLVLALGATTTLFYAQSQSARGQLEQAAQLNTATRDLLRIQGVTCIAASQEFTRTTACIQPLLQAKDFKEDGFSQPSEKGQGYLVVKNTGSRSYAAQNFTFSFNRVVLQSGCTIPGNIDKGVACRFNFDERCEEGSVLEVNYTGTKVFTKVC